MEIYMVGGAVRDALLGLPVKDHDWVLVGADPQQLTAQGYLPVGKDFPVFLHPQTREEYALARTERKTAPGYHGFAFHAAREVTLEQDLARRDLTINAMAVAQQRLDAEGRFPLEAVEDPFGGRRDLEHRVLRHVTDAFREDPVRILRLARFAARFGDFAVAPETLVLMRGMVDAGEVAALVAERVWQELARGLMEATPSRMLQVLADCGALAPLLPALAPVLHTQASATHAALDRAALANAALPVRFALLCLPLQDATALSGLCEALRVPLECRDLALLLQRANPQVPETLAWDAMALIAWMERCDAFRKGARFLALLQASALAAGPATGQDAGAAHIHEACARLRSAHAVASAVATAPIAAQAQSEGLAGPQVGTRIHAARIAAVRASMAHAPAPSGVSAPRP